MTDAVALALLAAIPPTLMALASFVSSLKNGQRAFENNLDATKKANTIHDLVNGNMADVKAELKAATARLQAMDTNVADLKDSLATANHQIQELHHTLAVRQKEKK